MKIGIVALLQNLDPAYSVATVVRSHLRIIKSHGHVPVLLTSTDSTISPEDLGGVEVRKVLPVWQFTDYREATLLPGDEAHVEDIVNVLKGQTDIEVLVDHDCCLQGWFLPYGVALNRFPNIRHVIHSVPGGQPLLRLREGHKLLVLNEKHIERAKQCFRIEDVAAIPNPLDIREYLGFHETTRRFIKDWNLLGYDYIFTYPLSATRWEAKGVPFLTQFTKYMSNQGYRVACVLLLAHGQTLGKFSLDECHFSNCMYDEFQSGVSREVVRDFMLLSDGFFFPSVSELSPLVHMEAALAKNPIYLNRALKLASKARTADMSQTYNWNFEILLRDFLENTTHLDEFRRVRKDMNEDVIGKRLIEWICN